MFAYVYVELIARFEKLDEIFCILAIAVRVQIDPFYYLLRILI